MSPTESEPKQQTEQEHQPQPIILHVEDDHFIRTAIGMSLAKEGYQVVTANNGQQALEYLEEAKPNQLPDLIVTDLNMPEMDGAELIRRIRSDLILAQLPCMLYTSTRERHLPPEAQQELSDRDTYYTNKLDPLQNLHATIKKILSPDD